MDNLPLVLCGPIVRRTTPEQVCVWVALRKTCSVELTVFEDGGGARGSERLRGSRDTVQLAQHLHVVAVTASVGADQQPLEWGESYLYELKLAVDGVWQGLYDEGVLCLDVANADATRRLVYGNRPLPGFRLPSSDLRSLRIAHGSCRKPHGSGLDALAALDDLLATESDPPQMLVLTGDQIYADDVEPNLLQAIIDVSEQLFDGEDREKVEELTGFAELLQPGQRQTLMAEHARFTSHQASSHLVTLAEYYTMYLFAWSDVFWKWRGLVDNEGLAEFRRALPQVRRALANISTYTIFDDHDVTDDWNRTGKRVDETSRSEIGPRVLRNALVAYALFQHWGNEPDAYADGGPGAGLLAAVDRWDGTAGAQAVAVRGHIYVPDPGFDLEPIPAEVLRWHYSLETPQCRMVVLDCRTRRRFRTPDAPPGLMSPAAIDEILDPDARPKSVTLVISPTPILGVQLIEYIQKTVAKLIDLHRDETDLISGSDQFDAEAWAFDTEIFDYLLERLATFRRVVVLSGDVHYGFGASLVATDLDARIVNFVASSLHNEAFSSTVAKLLSWIGDHGLESVGTLPTELPESALSREGSTEGMVYQEDLLSEAEPLPHDAPGAERGEIETEALTGRRRRAEVVGNTNLGEVVFPDGKVEHRLRWRRVDPRGIKERITRHVASFPIDQ